jgi:hypothetical protein
MKTVQLRMKSQLITSNLQINCRLVLLQKSAIQLKLNDY